MADPMSYEEWERLRALDRVPLSSDPAEADCFYQTLALPITDPRIVEMQRQYNWLWSRRLDADVGDDGTFTAADFEGLGLS